MYLDDTAVRIPGLPIRAKIAIDKIHAELSVAPRMQPKNFPQRAAAPVIKRIISVLRNESIEQKYDISGIFVTSINVYIQSLHRDFGTWLSLAKYWGRDILKTYPWMQNEQIFRIRDLSSWPEAQIRLFTEHLLTTYHYFPNGNSVYIVINQDHDIHAAVRNFVLFLYWLITPRNKISGHFMIHIRGSPSMIPQEKKPKTAKKVIKVPCPRSELIHYICKHVAKFTGFDPDKSFPHFRIMVSDGTHAHVYRLSDFSLGDICRCYVRLGCGAAYGIDEDCVRINGIVRAAARAKAIKELNLEDDHMSCEKRFFVEHQAVLNKIKLCALETILRARVLLFARLRFPAQYDPSNPFHYSWRPSLHKQNPFWRLFTADRAIIKRILLLSIENITPDYHRRYFILSSSDYQKINKHFPYRSSFPFAYPGTDYQGMEKFYYCPSDSSLDCTQTVEDLLDGSCEMHDLVPFWKSYRVKEPAGFMGYFEGVLGNLPLLSVRQFERIYSYTSRRETIVQARGFRTTDELVWLLDCDFFDRVRNIGFTSPETRPMSLN